MKPILASLKLPSYALPIAQALKKLKFHLSRPGLAHLFVGYADIKEARFQMLPEHIQISARQRSGKRVPVHKRHLHDQVQ